MMVDESSPRYRFCPGKATWYPWLDDVYGACLVAYQTGILPKGGGFEDQDELFVEAFPAFIQRWRDRTYDRIWKDVRDFTGSVLQAVFGKRKG